MLPVNVSNNKRRQKDTFVSTVSISCLKPCITIFLQNHLLSQKLLAIEFINELFKHVLTNTVARSCTEGDVSIRMPVSDSFR